jgi:dipeptidyl aminopeptidase/acylaminoacyl peptidase
MKLAGSRQFPVALVATAMGMLAFGACDMSQTQIDRAITQDPAQVDSRYPADMTELAIPIEGTRLNGLIYLATGAGPHPTILFLHGYPGNERNLDLAQIVRRAGYNAVYFNYRGSWGSGGSFSWANSVDDTLQVIRFLRAPDTSARLRVQTDRIIMVGHSLGGWVALKVLAMDDTLQCAATIAGFNLGRAGAEMRQNDSLRGRLAAYFSAAIDQTSGPLHGDPEALVRELMMMPERYDLVSLAATLQNRSLLLISGTKDVAATTTDHHMPVVQALQSAGSKRVKSLVITGADHNFSSFRIELAHSLLTWLAEDCPR